jgi:hypothetical protein
MKVIVINGSARSGKDQFTNYVKKHYDGKCMNWSTIDKVKKISRRNLGWDGKKTEEARKFLSEIKRVWGEYNNGPFMDITKRISTFNSKLNKKNKKNIIYFIHCREPYEIQKFVDKYGDKCMTVLLKRDDREVPDNLADKNVGNFDYNVTIQNNGNKKDLEKDAIKFIESWLKSELL